MLKRDGIAECLESAGFQVDVNPPEHLAGEHENNICNRGMNGRGIQIEIDKSVRTGMFRSLSRNGRKEKKADFYRFVEAIRTYLEENGCFDNNQCSSE